MMRTIFVVLATAFLLACASGGSPKAENKIINSNVGGDVSATAGSGGQGGTVSTSVPFDLAVGDSAIRAAGLAMGSPTAATAEILDQLEPNADDKMKAKLAECRENLDKCTIVPGK